MTRTMRSVLRLSWGLRKFPTSTKRLCSLKLFHSSSSLDARFNRPVLSSETHNVGRALDLMDVEQIDRPNTIMSQLRKCRQQEEILQLAKREASKLNGFQALKFLEILFDMEKQNPTNNSNVMYKRTEFGFICDSLKKHIRQLTTNQVIGALKYLTYFEVPSATVIIQMLLQMIRTSVNQLTLEEIVFLNFLLQKCHKTPLVEALSIALPIVFETQINTKLDSENLEELIKIIRYLRKTNISTDTVSRIFHIFENKYSASVSPAQAKEILFCLLDWKCTDSVKALIPKMLDAVTPGIDKLNESEMTAMLRRMTKNFKESKDSEAYYHEGFADACGASVVSRDLGFSVAMEVLTYYLPISHINTTLLDYMSAKCFEDSSILSGATPTHISSFLYALSQADYKPVYWDTIKTSLMSEKCLDANFIHLNKYALYMTQLDCYFPKIFEKTFTQFDTKADTSMAIKKRFSLLYYAVQNTFPEYSGPWPSEEALRICAALPPLEKTENPLLTAIENTLGGPQYVASMLRSKLGYYVDHVVIMRKGGFPIAINNPKEPQQMRLDDLRPPPDSQTLIFLTIPKYGCPRNSDRLTGYWSFVIKQLEAETKNTVIPIAMRMWENMSDQEQVRYISQAIRLKCDELSAIVN